MLLKWPRCCDLNFHVCSQVTRLLSDQCSFCNLEPWAPWPFRSVPGVAMPCPAGPVYLPRMEQKLGLIQSDSMDLQNDPRFFQDNVLNKRLTEQLLHGLAAGWCLFQGPAEGRKSKGGSTWCFFFFVCVCVCLCDCFGFGQVGSLQQARGCLVAHGDPQQKRSFWTHMSPD